MNLRVFVNIFLIFCGGSVSSWALMSWLNSETIPNKQDGNITIIVGLIGLIMFITGLASQFTIKNKED